MKGIFIGSLLLRGVFAGGLHQNIVCRRDRRMLSLLLLGSLRYLSIVSRKRPQIWIVVYQMIVLLKLRTAPCR